MDKYGLIGYPLGHSFSKIYFTEKFQKEGLSSTYELFPLSAITEFPELIEGNPELRGLNVTIPYKESVMTYLTDLSPEAKAIGAVNVIKIDGDRLTGYNSDYIGFRDSLKPMLRDEITEALVLGSGGASKAVCHALRVLGINPTVVSRHPSEGIIGYKDITSEVMEKNLLIVNTTPLGMAPNIEAAPDIPYHLLSDRHICYDVVYNPSETLFMKKAAAAGARVKNGLEMLHLQAENAWKIWN